MKIDIVQLDVYLATVEDRWNTPEHCSDKSYREGFRDGVALVRSGIKSSQFMTGIGVGVEQPPVIKKPSLRAALSMVLDALKSLMKLEKRP